MVELWRKKIQGLEWMQFVQFRKYVWEGCCNCVSVNGTMKLFARWLLQLRDNMSLSHKKTWPSNRFLGIQRKFLTPLFYMCMWTNSDHPLGGRMMKGNQLSIYSTTEVFFFYGFCVNGSIGLDGAHLQHRQMTWIASSHEGYTQTITAWCTSSSELSIQFMAIR